MKETVIKIYKPLGLTPLELIEKFRLENEEYKASKIAYAGRLDPMAHGEIILLIDEECKNRDLYQGLDKEYEFEVLFGVRSDTFDILGRLVNESISDNSNAREADRRSNAAHSRLWNFPDLDINLINTFKGKQNQKYPPYSSYNVNGHPLLWWARNNKLDEIEIPSKEIEIYSLDLIGHYEISPTDLHNEIIRRIDLVKGDFRQEEIKKDWEEFFKNVDSDEKFKIYKFKAKVSSGTYIRQLIHEMGEKLEFGALAFDINRTKVFL